MGTTDDDIDKFITAVHGAKYVRALAQSVYIPVGVIIHLKSLCFELDDRNKCDALPDISMLTSIYIAQLIVMSFTRNQDDKNTERLKKTSMPELTVSNFTTSKL